MSMAIAEASIWGLPIIESDIIGTSWNRNNPSTFLFEVGNVEMLAEKMEEFLNMDKEILIKNSHISKSKNMKKLSMDSWVNEVIRIFIKVLNEDGRRES